jgi:hypothetical protein
MGAAKSTCHFLREWQPNGLHAHKVLPLGLRSDVHSSLRPQTVAVTGHAGLPDHPGQVALPALIMGR